MFLCYIKIRNKKIIFRIIDFKFERLALHGGSRYRSSMVSYKVEIFYLLRYAQGSKEKYFGKTTEIW